LQRRQLIIGVDRLDYSKGIPERLKHSNGCSGNYPENLGKVSMLQIAPISRGDVDAYSELRRELEELAGRINGAFAQLD
jgi:trehalose 6-phosphate synthase